VGVLMLVIGYVAPLPAARPARTVTQGGVNDAQA
jgi:hypothetical protein